jgi:uncharacterized OsmC-like protein
MAVKSKEFRYAVDLIEGDTVRTEEGAPLGEGAEWTPEHLLIAALIRCSLASLRHHAKRADIEVGSATGSVQALFLRREADGRFAIAEAGLVLNVHLVPSPGEEERAALLQKAERDCFIGASLTVAPSYVWNVS